MLVTVAFVFGRIEFAVHANYCINNKQSMQCIERLQRKLAAQLHPAHTTRPIGWLGARRQGFAGGLDWSGQFVPVKPVIYVAKKCELPVLFLIEQNPFLISEIWPENLKNASPAPDFRPGDAFQRLWTGILEVFWLFFNA